MEHNEEYLQRLRMQLGPAIAAYQTDPNGKATMLSSLETWKIRCSNAGIADTMESRAAAITALQPLIGDDSLTGDELRDQMATTILSLLS